MAMIAPAGAHAFTFRHAHLFVGLGGGAQGFNDANPRIGHLRGNFVCAGGIDNDAKALRNFERLAKVPGTCMDLFDREQYVAFHGKDPPAGWVEACPDDIYRTFGPNIDVLFTSAPCKGFSGLLSASKSKTDKYQALNRLTVRGVWLTLEAYKHDPIPIILFENVPRIASRGESLMDLIDDLFRAYGYIVNAEQDNVHDCGEIGGLAQTRKRFLRIARHPGKIPPFVYQPTKHRLRGVGEVIGKLPLPGDPVGGTHHRIPRLQWQTWVRLALVEAGKDWRSLNRLRVLDGVLQDYGLVPEFEPGKEWRDNVLGVLSWADPASHLVGNQRSPLHGKVSVADPRPNVMMKGGLGVVTYGASMGVVGGESMPTNGKYAVADPRIDLERERGGGGGVLGVNAWDGAAATISTRGFPLNGAYSVADPRLGRDAHYNVYRVSGFGEPAGPVTSSRDTALADPRPGNVNWHHGALGVRQWGETSGTVPGRGTPTNGAFSLADPRIDGHEKSVQLGVRDWNATGPCIKGDVSVGTGPYAIADIRLSGRPRFNNCYRVVRYEDPSVSVPGPGGPGGGLALGDPRAPHSPGFKKNKYKVTRYDGPAGSVIGASTTGDGAFALADPRGGVSTSDLFGNWHVASYDGPSKAVVAQRTSGAAAIADPRGGDDARLLHGKYRVEIWIGPSKAVIAGRDQGAYALADPRPNWGVGGRCGGPRVTPEDQPAGTVPANAHSVTGGQPCVADSRRANYQTGGHYGVLPWSGMPSLAISGSANHDNGFNSVADPRECILEPERPIMLPAPTEKLVCRIVAEDETWHRPFTTLELAGLQSLFEPEQAFGQDPETGIWMARTGFELIGGSDALVREWIGNAVPSAAARGMAVTIGETLILARAGETAFKLDSRPIWCKPLGLALAVDSRQIAYEMDGGMI